MSRHCLGVTPVIVETTYWLQRKNKHNSELYKYWDHIYIQLWYRREVLKYVIISCLNVDVPEIN